MLEKRGNKMFFKIGSSLLKGGGRIFWRGDIEWVKRMIENVGFPTEIEKEENLKTEKRKKRISLLLYI